MSFTSLLIQSCTIQAKTLVTSGYEKTKQWSNIATDVPCRKNAAGVSINDLGIRVNTDDDKFFFLPGVSIARGNRIVLDGDNYDVIDVNKMYNSSTLHHLEVTARIVDHD